MSSAIAVDIGGTFTDVAAFDAASGRLYFEKTSSTPEPDVGALTGLRKLGALGFDVAGAEVLKHGTTVVINSILERKGARAALVTTRGFRDVLEIGRGNRPESFNLMFSREPSFIPRDLRFEVTERMTAKGAVHKPLDMDELAQVVAQIRALEIEAVAVCFLHSYRNPAHEIAAAAYIAANTDCFVTASHELSGEFREFERSSTTAINAFVGPKAGRYVERFRSGASSAGFGGQLFLMGSAGGILTAGEASSRPVLLIESGPVGGAAGAAEIGRITGNPNVIAFDMGGTTAKTVMIENGEAATTPVYYAAGYNRGHPVQAAVLDIVEVGAGGGSIAAIGAAGILEVGPRSAGSVPGPACYGAGGTEPTVTDANLVLGRLNAGNFLGGEMRLSDAAAAEAVATLAGKLGQTPEAVAIGILHLATLTMASSVRMATLERGHDPRDFAIVAYGGAGPLHAAAVAREMGCHRVIVPGHPGHFCAFGMLFANLRADLAETLGMALSNTTQDELRVRFDGMTDRGIAEMRRVGATLHEINAVWSADMRYQNQEHTLSVRLSGPEDLTAARMRSLFEETYRKRYGRSMPALAVDLVDIRVAINGVGPRPEFATLTAVATPTPTRRKVYFGEGWTDCDVWQRADLSPGVEITGPAIIEEAASTTVLHSGDSARVDQYGNIHIEVGA